MKHIKFLLITLGILLTRGYDYISTRNFTPDLSKEANPLVSIFGFKWIGLTITLIILTIYTLYTLYVNTYKKIDILPKEKGLSFKKFTLLVYLGYKARWVDLLYKLPNNLSRFNYVFGHILSRSLLWAGLITTVMWILIHTSKKYASTYHNVLFIYGIIIIGCFIISYLYFRKLYKIYKALQTS